jgi:hypothetical protein
MTSAKSASLIDGLATLRARQRTLFERRKRFWRRIALFLLVTIVIVLVALANRDLLQWRDIQKKAALVANALQQTYTDRKQDPPLRFPDLPEPYQELHKRYHFNIFYADQQKSRRRVGVCCLQDPARFFLRADGRTVILFDGKQFTARWMTESEFRAAALGLGFDSSLLEK